MQGIPSPLNDSRRYVSPVFEAFARSGIGAVHVIVPGGSFKVLIRDVRVKHVLVAFQDSCFFRALAGCNGAGDGAAFGWENGVDNRWNGAALKGFGRGALCGEFFEAIERGIV
jgi:hypothetical protein